MGEDRGYYDINKTLSRQRLFNFVVGARGCGKTYGAKKKAINNFLRRNEQFVYVRRYDTELPAAEIANFFDDIQEEFPEHEFKAARGVFKIDDVIAGWYFPLSKATMLKSIPFPRVTLMIFDEFIIDTGMKRYLPNEVTCFLEAYSTVSRDRDITAVFLSNALTMYNPYFLYFDVKFEPNQRIYLTDELSVEILNNEVFMEHMQQTRFGKLIGDTDYGKYAMNNEFLLDNDTFIEKMDGACSYICTFVFQDKPLGFYINNECNTWYLSEKLDETNKRRYTLDVTNHCEETILSARNNVFISTLAAAFCSGRVRFEKQSVKNACMPVLKKII